MIIHITESGHTLEIDNKVLRTPATIRMKSEEKLMGIITKLRSKGIKFKLDDTNKNNRRVRGIDNSITQSLPLVENKNKPTNTDDHIVLYGDELKDIKTKIDKMYEIIQIQNTLYINVDKKQEPIIEEMKVEFIPSVDTSGMSIKQGNIKNSENIGDYLDAANKLKNVK